MHIDFQRPGYYSDPFSDVVKYRMKRLERPTMTISAGQLGSGKSFSQLALGETCDFCGWVKDIQNGQKFTEISPSLLFLKYHCHVCGHDSSPMSFKEKILSLGQRIKSFDEQIVDYQRGYIEKLECSRCHTQTADIAVLRYDPCFDHKHVSFLPQDYLKAIRTSSPGEYILFDEPGAEASARRFMTIKNQLLNRTIITFRSLKIGTGWAVPILNLQDITANRLVNFLFIMSPNEPGSARFYSSWTNPRTAQTGATQYGWTHFMPPFQDRPEEMKEYLEMKYQYQSSSYDKYYKEFETMEKKESGEDDEEEEINLNEIVKKVLADIVTYRTPKGLVNKSMVRVMFPELKNYQADAVKALVERDLTQQRVAVVQKKEVST